jgi:predicted N-acyltransferase
VACYTARAAAGGGEERSIELSVRTLHDLSSVDAATWDALDHGRSPFLEHGFLRALELSGSVGDRAGWRPRYLLAETPPGADRRLVGAVVAYVKRHSYGEYIFDFAWARGSQQAGVPYYPKLVIAAPVTPATGHRILLARDHASDARAEATRALVTAVRELADAERCSSIHWLFTTAEEQALLAGHGFAPRASYQFHWHDDGYRSFDDFLARLASRKRKQIRKERRRCREQIDGIDLVAGPDLVAADVDAIDRFYRRTTRVHGGEDYLRPGFFHTLRELAPHRLLFARVRRAGALVAGALYLETPGALYGRYWGSDVDIELLHFETAYYVGIERCIARGIPLFEAGAQGEHKLLRGFVPTRTYSSHWIRHEGLDRAVRAYLREEEPAIEQQMRMLASYAPFKHEKAP